MDEIENFSEGYQSKLLEYDQNDIFNCDETGIFYKQSHTRTYTMTESDKANGKFSKERINILFSVSRSGEKLKPVVIGKSRRPRCFKNVKNEKLPTHYFYNSKSWMSSKIFKAFAEDLNSMMVKEDRKII
ncbi:Tigger transposable element-derived protein 6 [Dictyocoela muelleri]|nr:Tigger transposable element-derived protein 6 [Dictyocoela muelleri]